MEIPRDVNDHIQTVGSQHTGQIYEKGIPKRSFCLDYMKNLNDVKQ